MLTLSSDLKIPARKLRAVINDPKKSAQAISLIYVDDKQPGISRIKEGDNFCYYLGNKKLRDKADLDRIKKLAIPPAWENVWICKHENGHLQATGIDAKQRKQYRYHSLWSNFRNHTKFYRLYEFGKAVPLIRQQLKKDLARPGLPVEKVLAAVVYLMEQTSIRIGNCAYEKLYGSFGLTTLKDQHVKIAGDKLQLRFIGKKGIAHNISLNSRKLARVVKQCRDIPGKQLFQYYDQAGNHHAVDSGMVNAYLKSITGQDFTAKDFRTWIGTVQALNAFKKLDALEAKALQAEALESEARKAKTLDAEGERTKQAGPCGEQQVLNEDKLRITKKTQAELKKNILCVLDEVAAHLGNTRMVCKKYYVHPIIIDLYERDQLHVYFQVNCEEQLKDPLLTSLLSAEEQLLLHVLEKEKLV